MPPMRWIVRARQCDLEIGYVWIARPRIMNNTRTKETGNVYEQSQSYVENHKNHLPENDFSKPFVNDVYHYFEKLNGEEMILSW
jgi:hypothetical protein